MRMKPDERICELDDVAAAEGTADGLSAPLLAFTRLLARQAAREWVEAQLGASQSVIPPLSEGGAHG